MGIDGLVELVSETVLSISWQATLLGIMVVCIQGCFSRWLRPEFSSLLWLVVIVRLILVSGPESWMSVSNYTGVKFSDAQPWEAVVVDNRESVNSLEAEFYIIRILSTIWVVGVFLGLVGWMRSKFYWHRQLKRAELVGDPDILNALADAETELGIEPQVTIVHSNLVESPMLYGVFKPRLIIPRDLIGRLTPNQWRLIFRHEVAHIKRCDILTVNLISLFLIFHWFNPVLRWLLDKVLVDIELAADSMALRSTSQGEQKLYARTLLTFVERQSMRSCELQPLRVSFWDSEREIFSRFHRISEGQKGVRTSLISGVVLLVILVVTGLTDPVFPRPVQPFSFDTIRVLVNW